MAPLTLEGDTLGKKHHHYNRVIKEAIKSHKAMKEIDINESDVENLLKIDMASNTKNIEYLVEVLKCEDMLYVSRAIKQCTWLITDQQYAHIINPEYLHTQLLPQMTSKAFNKLMLNVRLHLKDETRVESFYNHYKEKNHTTALKWLPHCSLSFIHDVVKQHSGKIQLPLLKRLCKKSITILEVFINNFKCYKRDELQATMFLLKTNTEKYMDIAESVHKYEFPNFGKEPTEIIMLNCPHRILNDFERYAHNIHIPTFAKYLKREDIKGFLLKHVTNEELRFWFTYDTVKHFIELMPAEEQFEFVKQVFIDKLHLNEDSENIPRESEKYKISVLYSAIIDSCSRLEKAYNWYKFASFDVAFTELKKVINNESSPYERDAILSVMITCAKRNLSNIHSVLKYYRDKYMNDKFEFKSRFVNNILSLSDVHKYDKDIWNILEDLFHSMDIYTKTENDIQSFIEPIILYKVLHEEQIPKIVDEKFQYNTLKTYKEKLTETEKEKVFSYLYNRISLEIQDKNINNKTDYDHTITLTKKALGLLVDWRKELTSFPFLHNKIKDLAKIKKENKWDTDLSSLYNMKKSWRRYLFEESIVLCPTEEVCMNALKHDPGVLSRYRGDVEALCFNDAMSLRRLLNKLRVYWPQSLADEWTAMYRARLQQPGGHRALVRGLCTLLPEQQLLDLIRQYTPAEAKINWSEVDEHILSLQHQIAKNMHYGRPQPSPDAILWYAKGDYLQYALPSLSAIFYNLSTVRSREYIPRLLDAPVSLQKHGIRFAFVKLNTEEIKQIFSDIWKTTQNTIIRSVIFKLTFHLLCQEKDPVKIKLIWELLEIFIDNLSFKENKIIYELLLKVELVPLDVRANFLMKSYKFLKSLIPEANKEYDNYEDAVYNLAKYLRDIMEFTDPEFVTSVLLEFINTKYTDKESSEYDYEKLIPVISSFILCTKAEETQMERYEKIFVPLMKRCMGLWEETYKKEYYIRRRFYKMLMQLRDDIESIVIRENKVIPVKMFTKIQNEIQKLSVPECYVMLRKWDLIVNFTNNLSKYHNLDSLPITESLETLELNEDNNKWDQICLKVAPDFGKTCCQYLKEDVLLYFPNIYILFSEILGEILNSFTPNNFKWEIYKNMLEDKDFILAYLLTIKLLPEYDCDESNSKLKELKENILKHPSVEVKMHYYYKFKNDV